MLGEIGCTITTLLFYYVPVAHRGNFGLAVVFAVLTTAFAESWRQFLK
jgi:hypothetical protein